MGRATDKSKFGVPTLEQVHDHLRGGAVRSLGPNDPIVRGEPTCDPFHLIKMGEVGQKGLVDRYDPT